MKTKTLYLKFAVALCVVAFSTASCGSGKNTDGTTQAGTSDTAMSSGSANHSTEPKEPAGTSYPGNTDSSSTATDTPPAQK